MFVHWVFVLCLDLVRCGADSGGPQVSVTSQGRDVTDGTARAALAALARTKEAVLSSNNGQAWSQKGDKSSMWKLSELNHQQLALLQELVRKPEVPSPKSPQGSSLGSMLQAAFPLPSYAIRWSMELPRSRVQVPFSLLSSDVRRSEMFSDDHRSKDECSLASLKLTYLDTFEGTVCEGTTKDSMADGQKCKLKEGVCGNQEWIMFPVDEELTCKCKKGEGCDFEPNHSVEESGCQANMGFVCLIIFVDLLITNMIGFCIHKMMIKPEVDALRGVTRKIGLISILACCFCNCYIFLCMPLDEAPDMEKLLAAGVGAKQAPVVAVPPPQPAPVAAAPSPQ